MVAINCDMGESYGLYRMGDDAGIMPFITEANVACGYHASDPNHMRATVELAQRHGVRVGAHFSLPDLAGFGRREMKIGRDELVNIMIYQTGALRGFLDQAGVGLAHLKPHGALYAMAAREEETAQAVADVAEIFGVPVLGLSGTLHEEVCAARGVGFRAEFFADLDYDARGVVVITREHGAVDPEAVARRCVRALEAGLVTSLDGADIPVRVDTICVHSDTPGAVAVARAVHGAIGPWLEAA